MKRSSRRTHHDCAMLEWNLIRKDKYVSTRDFDELGVTSVAMFSNHLPFGAELFVTAKAEITATAADEIVHIDAVSRGDVVDLFAHRFHTARYFVPESHRQRIYRRNVFSKVRVGVADPAGCYPDQDFGRADLWKCNLGIFQWFPQLQEPHSSHTRLTRQSQRCTCQRMRMTPRLQNELAMAKNVSGRERAR